MTSSKHPYNVHIHIYIYIYMHIMQLKKEFSSMMESGPPKRHGDVCSSKELSYSEKKQKKTNKMKIYIYILIIICINNVWDSPIGLITLVKYDCFGSP